MWIEVNISGNKTLLNIQQIDAFLPGTDGGLLACCGSSLYRLQGETLETIKEKMRAASRHGVSEVEAVMSHHGKEARPDLPPDFGPTGRFPDGKKDADDQGELCFGVTAEKGLVVIAFGTPVAWLGLNIEHAEQLATELNLRVAELRLVRQLNG